MSVQGICVVCAKCTIGSEIIWTHSMVLVGNKAQVELILVRLEVVRILTQDSCMVCAKRTLGSEIISDALDGIPW